MYNLKDIVNVVGEIHANGWEVELSEFEEEVYLCGYKENEGIMATYIFNSTFEEMMKELDRYGYVYYESQD